MMNNAWTDKRKLGVKVGDWIDWDPDKLGEDTYALLSTELPGPMLVKDLSLEKNWGSYKELVWVAKAMFRGGVYEPVNLDCVKKADVAH